MSFLTRRQVHLLSVPTWRLKTVVYRIVSCRKDQRPRVYYPAGAYLDM